MPTLAELVRSVNGHLMAGGPGASPPAVTPLGRIEVDSRRIESGDVFWALVGSRHDGTDFVAEAFQRGAAGAVVRREVPVPRGRWAVRVADPLAALARYASHRRNQFRGTVIAVTGSVGKTTTRQMIHHVLRTELTGTASPRNYNNHVGLPLSVFQIESHHDYACLELGANRPGEIRALAEICRPQIGVITATADAHLAGFGDRHGVARAKAELLAALPPDGYAVAGDDPHLRFLAHQAGPPVNWVGRTAGCDLMATDVRCHGGLLSFRVAGQRFAIPVYGRHHLISALLAVAVALKMGLGIQQIAGALKTFQPVPMRCEVLRCGGAFVINDAYNANPASARAALELLRDFPAPGKRIAVLGDMAELGEQAARLHHQLGNEVVTVCGAHLLVACGAHRHELVTGACQAGMHPDRAIACRAPEETLRWIQPVLAPGDVLLVKGSRCLNMERLIDAIQRSRCLWGADDQAPMTNVTASAELARR